MDDSKDNEAELKTQKNSLRRNGTFACLLCPYSSDWRSNLKMHAERVHKTSIGELECCGISFSDKNAFRQHIAASHSRRFVCKTCGRCFTQATSLNRHVTKQSCLKKFNCNLCDYATSRKDYWDHHIQLHDFQGNKNECSSTLAAPADSPKQNSSSALLKETWFACSNCPFETKWEHSLKRHKMIHYRIPMESCWTNFSDRMKGRKRRALNGQRTADGRFQCATCNKVFKSAHLLRRHQPVHSGQKPFKCNFCDYASSRLWNLNHHKALKHKEKNQPTASPLSNQQILPDSLPNEGDVEIHRLPLSPRSLRPVVDKIALEPEQKQNEHELSNIKHKAMEPNKSPHSQSSFFQSASHPIVDSMNGETDEFDPQKSPIMIESILPDDGVDIQKNSTDEVCIFNCPVCPFNTKWPSALKRHVKIHEKQGIISPTSPSSATQHNPCSSSEPPLKKSVVLNCSLCPYSTKWPTNLKMHEGRMHKKKRCKCTTCGRVFSNVFVLRRHQKNHLLVKKFTCSVCNYASSQKGHLEKHMKSHKPREDSEPTVLSTGQSAECDTSLVRRLRSSRVIAPEREENILSGNDFTENGRRGVKRKRTSIDPVAMDVRNEGMVRGYEQKDQQREETQMAELSISESARQLQQSGRYTVESALSSPSKDSRGTLLPLPLSTIDSIYEEARLLRSQASQVQTVPSLLPLLLRLLELSSSTTKQIRATLEVEVRSRAIECSEYVWNASKMAIIRWDQLENATNRDTFLNAIRYAFGTLPVFINLEKKEHLEMLESVILLSFNTVKNWK
ncbi:hypothetical protein GHT06_022029 [Daphnia sinensis]|uniref:C2H2-type domain-containing protein n=1 Tax=Daphnia sinensis TaxID=1820382 RepID=A0AAD5KXD8_9CRUS|nr:hypothetical protein GHT06_022029 [Daphnia sinensis]